jgi:hypothetical protein
MYFLPAGVRPSQISFLYKGPYLVSVQPSRFYFILLKIFVIEIARASCSVLRNQENNAMSSLHNFLRIPPA